MPQYSFGTGTVFGKRTDKTAPTPVMLAALQGVTVDIAFTNKELYGRYQYPLTIARGTAKISGKADWAQFNAQAFNDLFFNENSVATGSVRTAVEEAHTVTSNAINVTHNTTFVADQGVVFASNQSLLTRVASAPTGDQYTVNESTGAYGFNNTLENASLKVSYTYADASNGSKIVITNKLLGNAPEFSVVLTESYNSKALTLVLNACVSGKLSLATKLEDFTIPSFDFMAYSDSSGNIGSVSVDAL